MTPAPVSGVRADLLGRVADDIGPAGRPLLVAVDGVDGAGKTCFADELAGVLAARGRTVVRASIDGFHHPQEFRHRHGRTPETVWRRHFDYRALRRELLDPWLTGAGASYRTAIHDVATDAPVDDQAREVPADGVLLVDGVFAQRAELEQAWDMVVWLEVPFEVSVSRLAQRDGTAADVGDPDQCRYLEAQRIYFETCGPRAKADMVVDNTDLDAPRLVGRDGEVPPGWAIKDGALVRTIRLPGDRVDLARRLNAVAAPEPDDA